MIGFFLYGYEFIFDGRKFTGNHQPTVDLLNQFTDLIAGYLPIGNNLLIILRAVYPEVEFDFSNEDRNQFFYLISFPDEPSNTISEVVI